MFSKNGQMIRALGMILAKRTQRWETSRLVRCAVVNVVGADDVILTEVGAERHLDDLQRHVPDFPTGARACRDVNRRGGSCEGALYKSDLTCVNGSAAQLTSMSTCAPSSLAATTRQSSI